MKYDIHVLGDAHSTAYAVAELIREKAVEKSQESKKLNIAVSGGSTPKQLFTLLGDDYETSIPWESVRLFWVDERCVDPDDDESNYGMVYDALLQKAFVPSANVFRMKGEDIPENEAERYQKILWEELPASDGVPVFDIILLGLGDDGHTASIFPYNIALFDSEFTVAVSKHPVTSQKRITLTGSILNNADEVLFLITGEGKAKVLQQIVKNNPEARTYPAGRIHGRKGRVQLYLDIAAASKL